MRLKNRYIIKAAIIALFFVVGDFGVFYALKAGMDRYYGLNRPARILCVGHSHTVLGIDARRMEKELGVPVAKYATAGANTLDRMWMIRHFLDKQPSVKTVIYDVDSRLFDSEGLSSASYTLFLPYIDDPAMAEYLRQAATWQETVTAKLFHTTRFRDQTINIALRGLLGRVENKKTTRIRIEDYRPRLDKEKAAKIRINPESRRCFLDTIDFLTDRNINVILLHLPTIDLLDEMDPAGQETVLSIFRELADKNSRVRLLDYNRDYRQRHDLFYDLRHLNGKGNKLVTGRLITALRDFGS